MSPATPEPPLHAVIDPAVLLREIMIPSDRPVCDAWRDGTIVPVVTLKILNHTLGLLHGLALPSELLEHWALWFTHAEHCVVVRTVPPSASILDEYLQAVRLGHAAVFLTDDAETARLAAAEGIATLSSDAVRGEM